MSIKIKNALGIERMGGNKKDPLKDPLNNLIVESHKKLGDISRDLNNTYPMGNEEPFSRKRGIALALININAAREILLETMSKYDLRG
jgi:hypothetical protein